MESHELGELHPGTQFWHDGNLLEVLGAPAGDDEFTRDGGGVVPCLVVGSRIYTPLPFELGVHLASRGWV